MEEKLRGFSMEIILYLFFGVLTIAVNIICYILVSTIFKINVLIANVLAWVAAVIFAFCTNRIWVFKSKKNSVRDFLMQMLAFCSGRFVTLIIEEIILWGGIVTAHWNGMLVKCTAQILVIVLNYIISKLWVFK